jgi:hypothetical protein
MAEEDEKSSPEINKHTSKIKETFEVLKNNAYDKVEKDSLGYLNDKMAEVIKAMSQSKNSIDLNKAHTEALSLQDAIPNTDVSKANITEISKAISGLFKEKTKIMPQLDMRADIIKNNDKGNEHAIQK